MQQYYPGVVGGFPMIKWCRHIVEKGWLASLVLYHRIVFRKRVLKDKGDWCHPGKESAFTDDIGS